MKRASLAVVTFVTILLTSLGYAKAQVDEAQVISVTVNINSIPEVEDFAEAFLTSLTENLYESGIVLSICQNVQPCEDSIAFMTIDKTSPLQFSSLSIYLDTLTFPVREISTILENARYTYLPVRFSLYPTSQQRIAIFVKLTTGILLYAQNRCDIATSYLDEAVEMMDLETDFSSTANYFLGNCSLIIGDFEAATMYFEATLGRSNYVKFYNSPVVNLAWTYLEVGREEEAFELMNRLVQNSGTEIEQRIYVLSKRAQLYALAFRFDEAIADMDAAIELAPDNPELYVQRGQIILLLYEWDRVLANYNRAIELDPDYADAYYYRGVLFYTQAHREESLSDFQRYLELAPDGDHAADAAQYVADIQRELDALTEP